MKKGLIVFVAIASLLALVPTVARAEEPQPYIYAMVQCSGLSVDELMRGQKMYNDQYGAEHQLLNSAMWAASYIARVNGFSQSVYCGQILDEDGNNLAGKLTFKYRVAAPVYQRILRNIPQ